MAQSLIEGPHLPPVDMFTFLIPLFLQCLLLHPYFPPFLSRPIRFLLMPFSVTLSFSAPYRYAIEPRNQAVGVNFVCGIMGGYGIWKGLEWGLARDLTPYTWVGHEEQVREKEVKNGFASAGSSADESANGSANGSAGDGKAEKQLSKEQQKRRRAEEKKAEHSRLLSLRAQQARTEGPMMILRSTLHLLIAMRGQGYAFCGTSTLPFPRSPRAFFRRLSLEIAWSHPLLTACAALLLEPATSRDAWLAAHIPAAVSRSQTHLLGEAITGLSMGVAVFAALTLGYSLATMLVFLPNVVGRAVLPARLRPPPFDARSYPPLFNFARRPSSVSRFWSKQWHSFFSRPFRFLAFDPVQGLSAPLVGKLVARTLGVLAVFALSSWIHEYGLATATSTLSSSPHPPPPASEMPFHLRWGGSLYFMAQGVGIILEGGFTAVSGRKVGGWIGTVWTALFCVVAGRWLVESWLTQGLLREVPPVRYWSWQRFVLPLGCLQPPPLWMKSLPSSYAYERHV
ncbi:hypothetical protein JCM10213_004878 [Rhodosporidiobolus nylandii]